MYTDKKVNIVYFCWCNPKKDYKTIITGQLKELISYNILQISKLYIEVCCEDVNLIENVKMCLDEILKCNDYEINFHEQNRYEYYGIKKLYDLAVLEPYKYFVYLHSKGIFNYDNVNERHIYEKTLTKGTIQNYKKIVELFDNNKNIMKACIFPANMHSNNFCWYNFYWAKGIYLITCENPIITKDRYYYERWSESGDNSMGTVYNIYENNYKKYILNEYGYILNMLNGTFPDIES